MSWEVREGDCRELMAQLDPGSVQTCVTSPPYFGLRDYGHAGQLGLEATPDEFVAALVGVFREVRRVLRDDGTLWLNLGDSYAALTGERTKGNGGPALVGTAQQGRAAVHRPRRPGPGLKPKDLIGVPWMVAFALRADGWFLRSDIIWHKPNPMPESVTDRPTSAHEHIFLFAKSARYFYDAAGGAETAVSDHPSGNGYVRGERLSFNNPDGSSRGQVQGWSDIGGKRNRRNVWTVTTQPYAGAHFATFPPKLIEPCILAGSREGDTVLDPFAGAGTTGVVALRHNRSFVGCELSPTYAEMARERIRDDAPLLNIPAEVAA